MGDKIVYSSNADSGRHCLYVLCNLIYGFDLPLAKKGKFNINVSSCFAETDNHKKCQVIVDVRVSCKYHVPCYEICRS